MNVPEDLVAMVERVRIFREVIDANADQVMLEDTVKLVSILSKESSRVLAILCFHCHVIKNKDRNHSIQKVENLVSEIDSLNVPKALPKIRYVRYFTCEIRGKMFYAMLVSL